MKNVISRFTGKFHIKFQLSLLMLIFIILSISSLSTLISVLSVYRNVSTRNAEKLFSDTGLLVENKLNAQMGKAVQLANLSRRLPEFNRRIEGDGSNHPGLPFLIEALDSDAFLYSIYTGTEEGDFLQLIRTSSNQIILDAHNAPPETSYILRVITGEDEGRIERWSFLDRNSTIISTAAVRLPEYNPAIRPWFRLSQQNPGQTLLTSPYVFNSLKKPGLTASVTISDDKVIGIDMTLAGIKSFLDSIFITEGTGMLILDENKRILAGNTIIQNMLNLPEEPLFSVDEIGSDMLNTILSDRRMLSRQLPWEVPGGNIYKLIITAPLSDFLGHQQIIQTRIIIIAILIFIIAVPIVILSSRSLSGFLEKLAVDAGKIQHFDYSGELPAHSPVIEFDELAEAFRVMKKNLAQKTTALETALQKLERIIELGIAMSVEKNSNKLVELILKGAKEISHADGGSLYLKNKNEILEFKIVLNDSLGFKQGGTSNNPISMPGVRMYAKDGSPNFHNVVSYACHKCNTVVIDDAYDSQHFDFSGTKNFDRMNNYRSKSFLTVPLKLQGSEVIGALQLINSKDEDSGEVCPFSSNIQGFVEALSAEAAAVLYNSNLMQAQEELFESLIQLTASAIDTKSPYTGGHCERVPQLAMMLAEEAENVKVGNLSGFKFKTDEERRAFRIGSWLHDAGKMTTPEFVVDKAVKLETIYNRIHEIRARFEIILRDIKIEEKDALISGEKAEDAAARRMKKEAELIDDFTFIADCNKGEGKPEHDWISRLEQIADRTWLSHFDHTIGLSSEEESRLEKAFIPGSTIEEKLLSDKAQHLVPYKKDSTETYKKYGFVLPHPAYLYNRGEIYNLSIPQGTLTTEERYKVNEHIMQTIVMLDQLPFPKGLAQITEFVGTHHETLTGSGYPRGLTENQLSIPSRIMAIADIFEALTASDRPYKKAKTLSEAIFILNKLKESRHIDPHLFRLFLESGIYKIYAEEYLLEEQIDDVDIDIYLNEKDFNSISS